MQSASVSRLAVVLVGATLMSVLGATTAGATEDAPDADDCGFSFIHQNYRNCTPGTEVVEITYVDQAPKGVGYPKSKFCIPFGQKRAVARPDGMLAEAGYVFPKQKCGIGTQ